MGFTLVPVGIEEKALFRVNHDAARFAQMILAQNPLSHSSGVGDGGADKLDTLLLTVDEVQIFADPIIGHP